MLELNNMSEQKLTITEIINDIEKISKKLNCKKAPKSPTLHEIIELNKIARTKKG